jgi:hypothetical protein
MAFNLAALFVTNGHFYSGLIFRDKARGYLVGALYWGSTAKPFTMAFNVATLSDSALVSYGHFHPSLIFGGQS